MRALILCCLFACSSGHKATQQPLVIDGVCSLTTSDHVLDKGGTDVGLFDRARREVAIGSIRQPVKFTTEGEGIVVASELHPIHVQVTGDRLRIDDKDLAVIEGFDKSRWLDLAALVTAIPALPVREAVDAGIDSAGGDDVPPPPPPPPPTH